MATLSRDTSDEAEAVQIRLLRAMPVWRKIQLASELTRALREDVMAELCRWSPQAGPGELRRRFATIWLGPDLAAKVYGPEPDPPTIL
jgi:hypothetical protein